MSRRLLVLSSRDCEVKRLYDQIGPKDPYKGRSSRFGNVLHPARGLSFASPSIHAIATPENGLLGKEASHQSLQIEDGLKPATTPFGLSSLLRAYRRPECSTRTAISERPGTFGGSASPIPFEEASRPRLPHGKQLQPRVICVFSLLSQLRPFRRPAQML